LGNQDDYGEIYGLSNGEHMMGTVTYSNLFSESRANVLSLINNTSNVSDPISNSSQARVWIHSRMPDVKASNFAGYPFIVIYPSDVDIQSGGSVDGRSKRVEWEIDIEIVTSDRGYNENDSQGLSHMDAISDDVMTTLLNKTNRNTLSGQNMSFSTPSTTKVVSEPFHSEIVYRRTILAPFKSKIQVSA